MRMKRKCELCSKVATIYCESDQATLCYECDSKVHGANFLVAKHSRAILCHICQSPTLRMGSGPGVGPTISLCQTCLSSDRDNVARHRGVHNGTGDHHHAEGDEDLDDYGDHDESDEDDDDDEDDDGFEEDESHVGDEDESEDDEENQVVPWSYSVSHPR